MALDLDWFATRIVGRELTAEEEKTLAEMLQERRVDAGEALITQGEPGSALYVLREGSAEVLVEQGQQQLRLATGGPGAIFGEMTFLTGSPATATVRATAPSRFYVLSREHALSLARKHPDLMFRLFACMLAHHARTVRRMNEEYAQLFQYLTSPHK